VDVKIGEVVTEMVVTEGVGALNPEEVKKLVTLVLEHIRREHDHAEQRARDVKINDRAFRPDFVG
jgi:polyhydroxyalkanoate synthesis regulator phasin